MTSKIECTRKISLNLFIAPFTCYSSNKEEEELYFFLHFCPLICFGKERERERERERENNTECHHLTTRTTKTKTKTSSSP